MSLKSETEHAKEEADKEYQRKLDEEGIIDFSHMLGSDFPSDLEYRPAIEDTNANDQPDGVSEFAQSAYDADTIRGEEEKTSDLVEVPIDSTNEEEWKPTPDSHRRKPAGPCDIFSPLIKRLTGANTSPSGSDSTHGNPRQENLSPNRNRFEALSQDDDDDEEEVVTNVVISMVAVDDQNGPPDVVRSLMVEQNEDAPEPSEEGAQETSPPVHQDETKGQDEQDFHGADLD